MSSNLAFKPVIRKPRKKFYYKRLFQWQKDYGRLGNDKKAIDAFMDNENAEYIRIFRNELMAVSKGIYDEKLFDRVLGTRRKKQHKSYMAWAKLMLKLMAAHKG